MKIGVISDTHGNKASILRALEAAGPVDMWLHAGDYSQDAVFLAERSGVPVTAAAGNCDGSTTAKIDEFVTAGGKKIWLTHGHRYKVRERSAELGWWGRHYGVDIVIYGHSHVADVNWTEGLLLFNPGSTVHPRGGQSPSFGLLDISGDQVKPSIVPLRRSG
ncbi:MAG: metallophosphoesterase [Negativicutes bacterium]|nr:metallophosphoesterase [Negativicutes bacterium]